MSVVAKRYFDRGRAALEQGDLDTALEALRGAIDLVPTFVSARTAYAVALARSGDTARAAQAIRAGLARTATPVSRAALWATLGDVLTIAGDFAAAEDAFQQAGQHPGFAARSAAGLARVYAKTGRFKESFTELARAAELAKRVPGS